MRPTAPTTVLTGPDIPRAARAAPGAMTVSILAQTIHQTHGRKARCYTSCTQRKGRRVTRVDPAHTRPGQRTRRLFHELLEDRRLLTGVTPNDPLFAEQSALENTGQTGGKWDADIDASAAWSVTTGNVPTIIAVLDTGVDYTHEDLYLNIWLNQGEIPATLVSGLTDSDADGLITFRDLNESANAHLVSDVNGTGYIDAGDLIHDPIWADGVDTDGNGYVDDISGYDFVADVGDPLDDHGHGTIAAGILGAIGNNGIGVAGVTWNSQIMPLRFHDGVGHGSVTDAAEAIDYAVANGAKVSNNSWGAPGWPSDAGYSEVVRTAIANAAAAGHIVVAAAGNGGDNNDDPSLACYPASYDLDNIVAVAAMDYNDELAVFSNYSATKVDLGAPGDHIWGTTTASGILGDASGYKYFSWGATSWAAPHVTGVVALLQDQNPEWTYTQVIDRILSTVDPSPTLQDKTVSGGRLNAAAALGSTSIDTPLFLDSFELGQWNGRWVEDSQNDWYTSTQRKTDGSYSAEVDGSASTPR